MNRTALLCASIAAAALLGSAALLTAGPLNPPVGPVASSYKTLTEVEPRIAVNDINTPGTATATYRISVAGSYYLTGNLAATNSKHAIEITASHVTLDLNGFHVLGARESGPYDGITVATGSAITNVTVRNGTVRNCSRIGVNLSASSGSASRVEYVLATECTSVGFGIGPHSIVSDCAATNNTSNGFSLQTNCTMTRCVATGNTFTGISVSDACSVSDCTSSSNGTQGFVAGASSVTGCAATGNTGVGISIASAGTATSCTANANAQGITGGVGAMIVGCTANNNTQIGISANDGGSIIDCTTRGNTLENIRCADGCLVRGNSCFSNVVSPTQTNLHATGGENRIENNTCTGATLRGFDVDIAGNILVGNSARGNATNWDIAAGNVGVFIAAPAGVAFTGNAGGTSPTTNPWANLTY